MKNVALEKIGTVGFDAGKGENYIIPAMKNCSTTTKSTAGNLAVIDLANAAF